MICLGDPWGGKKSQYIPYWETIYNENLTSYKPIFKKKFTINSEWNKEVQKGTNIGSLIIPLPRIPTIQSCPFTYELSSRNDPAGTPTWQISTSNPWRHGN